MARTLGRLTTKPSAQISFLRKLVGFGMVVSITLLWSFILVPLIGSGFFLTQLKMNMDNIKLTRLEMGADGDEIFVSAEIPWITPPLNVRIEDVVCGFANARNEEPFAYMSTPMLEFKKGQPVRISSKFRCEIPKDRKKIPLEKVMGTQNLLLFLFRGNINIEIMPLKIPVVLPYTLGMFIGEKPAATEALIDPLEKIYRSSERKKALRRQPAPRMGMPISFLSYRFRNSSKEAVLKGAYDYNIVPSGVFIDVPRVKFWIIVNGRRIMEVSVEKHRIADGKVPGGVEFSARVIAGEWAESLREVAVQYFEDTHLAIELELIEFEKAGHEFERRVFAAAFMEAISRIYRVFLRKPSNNHWIYNPAVGVAQTFRDVGIPVVEDPIVDITVNKFVGPDAEVSAVIEDSLLPLSGLTHTLNQGTFPKISMEARMNGKPFARAWATHVPGGQGASSYPQHKFLTFRAEGKVHEDLRNLKDITGAKTEQEQIKGRGEDAGGSKQIKLIEGILQRLARLWGVVENIVSIIRGKGGHVNQEKPEEESAPGTGVLRSFSLYVADDQTVLGGVLRGFGIYWVTDRGTVLGYKHAPSPPVNGPMIRFPCSYRLDLGMEEEAGGLASRVKLSLPNKTEETNFIRVRWPEAMFGGEALGMNTQILLSPAQLDILAFRDSCAWTVRSPGEIEVKIRVELREGGPPEHLPEHFEDFVIDQVASPLPRFPLGPNSFLEQSIFYPIFSEDEEDSTSLGVLKGMVGKIKIDPIPVIEGPHMKRNEASVCISSAMPINRSEPVPKEFMLFLHLDAVPRALKLKRRLNSHPFVTVSVSDVALDMEFNEAFHLSAFTLLQSSGAPVTVHAAFDWSKLLGSGGWEIEASGGTARPLYELLAYVNSSAERVNGEVFGGLPETKKWRNVRKLSKDPLSLNVDFDRTAQGYIGNLRMLFGKELSQKRKLSFTDTSLEVVLPKISATFFMAGSTTEVGSAHLFNTGIIRRADTESVSCALLLFVSDILLDMLSSVDYSERGETSMSKAQSGGASGVTSRVTMELGGKEVHVMALAVDRVIAELLSGIEAGSGGGRLPVDISIEEVIARRVTKGAVERSTPETPNLRWASPPKEQGAIAARDSEKERMFTNAPFVEILKEPFLIHAAEEKNPQKEIDRTTEIVCKTDKDNLRELDRILSSELRMMQEGGVPQKSGSIFSRIVGARRHAGELDYGLHDQGKRVASPEESYVEMKTLVAVNLVTQINELVYKGASKLSHLPLAQHPQTLQIKVRAGNPLWIKVVRGESPVDGIVVDLEEMSFDATCRIFYFDLKRNLEDRNATRNLYIKARVRATQEAKDLLSYRHVECSPLLALMRQIELGTKKEEKQEAAPPPAAGREPSKIVRILKDASLMVKTFSYLPQRYNFLSGPEFPFPIASLYSFSDSTGEMSPLAARVVLFEKHLARLLVIKVPIFILVKEAGKTAGAIALAGRYEERDLSFVCYESPDPCFLKNVAMDVMLGQGAAQRYTYYLVVGNTIIYKFQTGIVQLHPYVEQLLNRWVLRCLGGFMKPKAVADLVFYMLNIQKPFEHKKESYMKAIAMRRLLRRALAPE